MSNTKGDGYHTCPRATQTHIFNPLVNKIHFFKKVTLRRNWKKRKCIHKISEADFI